VTQTKYCYFSLKVKIFGHSQNFGLALRNVVYVFLHLLSPFCYELMWEALGQLKNTETEVTRGSTVQFV